MAGCALGRAGRRLLGGGLGEVGTQGGCAALPQRGTGEVAKAVGRTGRPCPCLSPSLSGSPDASARSEHVAPRMHSFSSQISSLWAV